MHLLLTLDHRFHRTPDGSIWTQTTFPHSFYQHYLQVFDHVRVIARILDVTSVPSHWKQANGVGVSFVALPYYVGLIQYLQRLSEIKQVIKQAFTIGDAVILRVSSPIANHLYNLLKTKNYPYGVEVVGDPYDVFAPGSVKHPLRTIFRWYFPRILRKQCAGACAASYVTEYTLQKRYPPSPSTFSTHYSSAELLHDAFVTHPRLPTESKNSHTIISIGTLDQLYKAPDVLIKAVAICVRQGLDLQLILVGDGKHRWELEELVTNLGVTDHVNFIGELPAGDAVRTELDQADIFVLPSHQEGLPRAMIEAMARALPCIGSTVGGFPELLPPEDMVPPGDVEALAIKIQQVLNDSERMAQMSARNLEKAREYREEVLQIRRFDLYRHLYTTTEQWMQINQKNYQPKIPRFLSIDPVK